jgi:hypothetical protein
VPGQSRDSFEPVVQGFKEVKIKLSFINHTAVGNNVSFLFLQPNLVTECLAFPKQDCSPLRSLDKNAQVKKATQKPSTEGIINIMNKNYFDIKKKALVL